ncbi:MAG TPA: ETX/MTX2 family pore-forming toxin [Herpetosiphonaceae bacterium]
MNQVTPADLAALLPLGPDEVIFQYEIDLDSTFPSPMVTGVTKLNTQELPAQFSKTIYKTNSNESWSIGFNLFQDGTDVWYQPFFWLESTPQAGRLTSSGKFQQAGTPCPLERDHPQLASVDIPTYSWLQCQVQPLFYTFALSIASGSVIPNTAMPTPQIAKTSTIQNTGSEPVTYTPEITYEYQEQAEASVTDTHSFQVGTKISYSSKVNWFGSGGEFKLELSFQYGYTYSTAATSTKSHHYTVSEKLVVTLQPGETKYISVIIDADEHATANVALDFQLSGTMNGEALPATFLQQVAEAVSNGTQVTVLSSTTVGYTITGTVQANVAAGSNIVVTDTPPTLAQVVALLAADRVAAV